MESCSRSTSLLLLTLLALAAAAAPRAARDGNLQFHSADGSPNLRALQLHAPADKSAEEEHTPRRFLVTGWVPAVVLMGVTMVLLVVQILLQRHMRKAEEAERARDDAAYADESQAVQVSEHTTIDATSSIKLELEAAANTNKHFRKESGKVTWYDEQMLLSLPSSFATIRNTVFCEPVLWSQVTLVFTMASVTACWSYVAGLYHTDDLLVKSADRMDSFARYLAGFNAFFLGLYTSISVGRWWRLRTVGIGSMWTACSRTTQQLVAELASPLEQSDGRLRRELSPSDAHLVHLVPRYVRLSLALLFEIHGKGSDNERAVESASRRQLCTKEEKEILLDVNNNLAEAVWMWMYGMLEALHEAGRIGKKVPFWQYTEVWNGGRDGAAVINGQLSTQLPFTYVSLIALMVHFNNMVLALLTGLLIGLDILNYRWIKCSLHLVTVLFVPLLYNSVLFVNLSLTNPLGPEVTDFPNMQYSLGMDEDAQSYQQMLCALPTTIRAKKAP